MAFLNTGLKVGVCLRAHPVETFSLLSKKEVTSGLALGFGVRGLKVGWKSATGKLVSTLFRCPVIVKVTVSHSSVLNLVPGG